MPANDGSTVACIADAQTIPTPPPPLNSCNDALTMTGPVVGPDPVCSGTKTYTSTLIPYTTLFRSWTYTYTITPPTFTMPANDGSTVACIADAQTIPTPPAPLNSCNDALTMTGPVVGPDPVCSGTKTYTWTFTDCTGASADWTYTYTIRSEERTIGDNDG